MRPSDEVLAAADVVESRARDLASSGMTAARATVVALLEHMPEAVSRLAAERREREFIQSRGDEGLAAARADLAELTRGLRCGVVRRGDRDFTYGGAVMRSFDVRRGDRSVRVDMPGVPHESWGFLRCYVDGNSWMWQYAREMIVHELESGA